MKVTCRSITEGKEFCSHVGCLIVFLLVLTGASLTFATGTAVGDQDGDYIYTTSGSPAVATITGYTGDGGAITIPSALGGYATVAIGESAFDSANGHLVTSVTIPSTVISIGNYAFRHCGALISVTIPDGVASIGNGTFQYSALTYVAIPGTVTSIGKDAFDFCTSLTAIDVDAGNTNYSSIDGVLYNKDATILIQCPGGKAGTFTIPISVTSVGDFAFSGCLSLTSVTIPDSVTSIGYGVFFYCPSLTSVTIGSGVTVVGHYAFASCTSLASVTIPDSVSSIGDHAFYNCTSLTSLDFLGLVAPTTVGADWIAGTVAGIRGHAYAASDFPAPGGVFHGLIMGAVIPLVPGAPTNLSATPGNTQVTITWTAPADDGGSPIINYKLYRSTTSSGTYALIASPSGLTYTDTGLTNGQTYWYKVSAANGVGEGPMADDVSATPESGGADNGRMDPMLMVGIAIVAIAVVGAAILFVMRSRK